MTISFPLIQQHNVPTGLTCATIPSDTSGSLTLCTGKAGYTVDAWSLVLSSAALVTISFKSASEVKFSFTMQAGIPFVISVPAGPRYREGTCAYPLFQTNDGESLTLTWSGSVQIDGQVLFNQRVTAAI